MNSFKYAIEGLLVMFKEERNARIHLIMAIASMVGGVYFNLSLSEWLFLVFAIGLVIALELINTAIIWQILSLRKGMKKSKKSKIWLREQYLSVPFVRLSLD